MKALAGMARGKGVTLSHLTRVAARMKDDCAALVALERMFHGMPVTTKKEVELVCGMSVCMRVYECVIRRGRVCMCV